MGLPLHYTPSSICGPMDAPQGLTCRHCGHDAFDFEDLAEGTRLICTDCGTVAEDVDLVAGGPPETGGRGGGVYVAADDDGTRAGGALTLAQAGEGGEAGNAALAASGAPAPARRIYAVNRARLDAALAFLQLPTNVCTASRSLLPLVLDANATAVPRRYMTACTIAAIVYLAAREEHYALSLGAAGSALSVPGVDVGREFRRLVLALKRAVPPPALSTLVLRAAAEVLPHYLGSTLVGGLRQQPVVARALDVAELVTRMAASDGSSPALAAAAVLAMCLSEQYQDARPSVYAAQLATLLGHDRGAVQRHVRSYETQLGQLLSLVPFAKGDGRSSGGGGCEVVRHARVLLQLHALAETATQGNSNGPAM